MATSRPRILARRSIDSNDFRLPKLEEWPRFLQQKLSSTPPKQSSNLSAGKPFSSVANGGPGKQPSASGKLDSNLETKSKNDSSVSKNEGKTNSADNSTTPE